MKKEISMRQAQIIAFAWLAEKMNEGMQAASAADESGLWLAPMDSIEPWIIVNCCGAGMDEWIAARYPDWASSQCCDFIFDIMLQIIGGYMIQRG